MIPPGLCRNPDFLRSTVTIDDYLAAPCVRKLKFNHATGKKFIIEICSALFQRRLDTCQHGIGSNIEFLGIHVFTPLAEIRSWQARAEPC